MIFFSYSLVSSHHAELHSEKQWADYLMFMLDEILSRNIRLQSHSKAFLRFHCFSRQMGLQTRPIVFLQLSKINQKKWNATHIFHCAGSFVGRPGSKWSECKQHNDGLVKKQEEDKRHSVSSGNPGLTWNNSITFRCRSKRVFLEHQLPEEREPTPALLRPLAIAAARWLWNKRKRQFVRSANSASLRLQGGYRGHSVAIINV